MNTSAIATILGATVLGMFKSKGSNAQSGYTSFEPENLMDIFNASEDYRLRVNELILDEVNYNFKGLEKIISMFPNIDSLSFQYPNITTIPSNINTLTNLKKLFAGDGVIDSIPPEIGDCVNLEELFLAGNKLTSLPSEICNLVKLKKLYVDWNDLRSIPLCILELPELSHLSIEGNNNLSIEKPDALTLRRLSQKLHPSAFRGIIEVMKESSELRRF